MVGSNGTPKQKERNNMVVGKDYFSANHEVVEEFEDDNVVRVTTGAAVQDHEAGWLSAFGWIREKPNVFSYKKPRKKEVPKAVVNDVTPEVVETEGQGPTWIK